MRIELTGRHIEITPIIRRLVAKKLAKLERVLNDSAVSAQVVLARERHSHRTEITLHARDDRFLHAWGASTTWETSIGEAVERTAQQVQKLKGKWQERKRQGPSKQAAAPSGDGLEPKAVGVRPAAPPRAERERLRMPRTLRASRQVVKSMSVADAARQVDAKGERIVVFLDTETSSVSVIYGASDGELTLVQTES